MFSLKRSIFRMNQLQLKLPLIQLHHSNNYSEESKNGGSKKDESIEDLDIEVGKNITGLF